MQIIFMIYRGQWSWLYCSELGNMAIETEKSPGERLAVVVDGGGKTKTRLRCKVTRCCNQKSSGCGGRSVSDYSVSISRPAPSTTSPWRHQESDYSQDAGVALTAGQWTLHVTQRKLQSDKVLKMLCEDQHCTYNHWILHANFDLTRKKKYSHVENPRLGNKKRAAISRLLDEIQQKHGEFTRNIQLETASVIVQKENLSRDNIPIPADPTSPYAFTVNVGNNPGTKKSDNLDQDQVTITVSLA